MDGQPLAGQRALVTGAERGIGAACAVALARAGASVLVNYLDNQGQAERLVAQISSTGGHAALCQADVSDEGAVTRLFAEMREHFGGLDILVSNAGVQADAGFTDMTLAEWRKTLQVDLTGGFLCARAAAREFLAQTPAPGRAGAVGKIIFISSVHQFIPWAGHANYTAAKGGLHLFMTSIAQELAPQRIRVNAIAPGAIATDINRAAWDSLDAKTALLKLIPYGRVGVVDDVAKAAVWLASDDSDYVTGITLPVDGGMLLYPAFQHGG